METLFTKLRALIGLPIRITINNSVSLKGSVIDIKPDHLYFKNEDGLNHYIQISGIREIVKNSKENALVKRSLSEVQMNTEETFKDLLKTFKEKWVMVSRTHMNPLQGVLCDVYEDLAVFIDKERLVFVPISQIDFVQDHVSQENSSSEKGNSNDSGSDNSSESQNKTTTNETNGDSDQQQTKEQANDKSKKTQSKHDEIPKQETNSKKEKKNTDQTHSKDQSLKPSNNRKANRNALSEFLDALNKSIGV